MKVLRTIWRFLVRLFTQWGDVLSDVVPSTITALETVKSWIDNPSVALLVRLTKTPIDDAILASIQGALNIILQELTSTTNDKDAHQVLREMKATNKAQYHATLHKAASQLTRQIARSRGQELKERDADTLVQMEYSRMKDKGLI